MDAMAHVERREEIGIDEFVRRFLEPNVPLILAPSHTSHWPARQDWVTSEGLPDFGRLAALYGAEQVPVADCDTVYFSDQQRTTMAMSEFISQWQAQTQRLYCKDWHFTRSPSSYQAYAPVPHLSNDWLNIYYEDLGTDDFRFCYMGGHGTWTPFHEDVFRSYSWSANICGEKRWILVPPGQTHLFTDRLGNWVHNILDYDQRAFPRLGELKKFEVVQKPGEALFVPSGWWHQVLNVGHTISINHNWSNEFNLQRMYERLAQDLGNVKHALRDVTDMDGFDDHAQLVLRADSGIDYRGFFAFVRHMATRYMKLCAGSPPPAGNWTVDHVDSYFTSPASVRRALEKIDSVLTLLASDPDTPKISGGLATEISCLRSEIKEALLVTH